MRIAALSARISRHAAARTHALSLATTRQFFSA
jgi:hypothetical protein